MPRGMLFWMIYVLCLVLSFWFEYTPGQQYPVRYGARNFVIFLLLGILGWTVFGAAVK